MLTKLGSISFVFFIWIPVWVCDDNGCGYGGGNRFLVGVVATKSFFFFGYGVWYVGEERRERHYYEVRVTMRKRLKWIKNE